MVTGHRIADSLVAWSDQQSARLGPSHPGFVEDQGEDLDEYDGILDWRGGL